MDDPDHKALLKRSMTWNQLTFIKRWKEVEESMDALGRYPLHDSKLLFWMRLLNKIIGISVKSFQRHAIGHICTIPLLLQLKRWFVNYDPSGPPFVAINVAKIVRKCLLKCFELYIEKSEDFYSSFFVLINTIVEFFRPLDPPDGYYEAISVLHAFQDLHLLKKKVMTVDAYSEACNCALVEELQQANCNSNTEYIVWLHSSLKMDFELGLKTQILSKNAMNEAAIRVKAVLAERQMACPAESNYNVIDLCIRMSKNDYNIISRKEGSLRSGSLCFLYKDANSAKSLVVTDKVTSSNSVVYVSFHLIRQKIIEFGTFYNLVTSSEVFFEPYLRVMSALRSLVYDESPILDVLLSPTLYWRHNYSDSSLEELLRSPTCINLNEVQKECLRSLLMHPVTLIHGPPGTGKTHLCCQMVKTLLDKRYIWDPLHDHQILIVTLKNDTLDKMLTVLRQDGRKVLRIGGMSKNFELKTSHNISSVDRKQIPSFKPVFCELASEKQAISERITSLSKVIGVCSKGIIPLSKLNKVMSFEQSQYLMDKKLRKWLFEFEEALVPKQRLDRLQHIRTTKRSHSHFPENFIMLQNIENQIKKLVKDIETGCCSPDFFIKIDAIHELIDLHYNIERLLEYRCNPKLFSKWRKFSTSLDTLSREERWDLYHYWKMLMLDQLTSSLMSEISCFQENENSLQGVRQIASALSVLNNKIEVIGATSCAAAKNRTFLENLRPKIVLVEEAAELLESHVVASLTKATTSLMLIGDPCQLAPSPASAMTHMSISMLERLMLEGLEPKVLNEQYRMREEIATLVSSLSYPSLTNGDNVMQYPHVRGMHCDIYFVDVVGTEKIDRDHSMTNHEEALWVVRICTFLVAQGYSTDKITILSPYNAQITLINKMLGPVSSTFGIRAVAVDGYQGEENDIIVLSFVRSNDLGSLGFLDDKRRLTVALSRAKLGLYMIGNAKALQHNKLESWKIVFEYLERNSFIGEDIPVCCRKHSVRSYLSQFDPTTEFCAHSCETKLFCGHVCERKCHSNDVHHQGVYRCTKSCERLCPRGHKCELICGDPCTCTVEVRKEMECGHTRELPCHVPTSVSNCTESVEFRLNCGHSTQLPCNAFHQNTIPVCVEVCGRANEQCPEGHACLRQCDEDCSYCTALIEVTLECGHTAKAACGGDKSKIKCEQTCNKLLSCGHICLDTCSSICYCSIEITKTVCDYGHTINMPCYERYKVTKCSERCGKTLPDCGHQCTKLCSEDCQCSDRISLNLQCRHSANVPCSVLKAGYGLEDYEVKKWCQSTCKKKLPCGHECTGKCGTCTGQIHKKCVEACSHDLLCGHPCLAECGDLVHICIQEACQNGNTKEKKEIQTPKRKKGKTLDHFDVCRQINVHLHQERKGTRNESKTSKKDFLGMMSKKLMNLVAGPLYEKISRIPPASFERNSLVFGHGMISRLLDDVKILLMSSSSLSIEKLKNIIFLVEFTIWVIRYETLELDETNTRPLSLPELNSILTISEEQCFLFSWDQISRIIGILQDVDTHHKTSAFNFTLRYSKPFYEHVRNASSSNLTDWLD